MKPDLGLSLQKEGVSKDVSLSFYDVPFQTISFLAPGAYTAMFDKEVSGVVYALSLDFDDEIFAQIISLIPAVRRAEFGQSLIGKTFPFSVDLPQAVTAKVIECRLGEMQRGAHDSFIPLVIVRLQ